MIANMPHNPDMEQYRRTTEINGDPHSLRRIILGQIETHLDLYGDKIESRVKLESQPKSFKVMKAPPGSAPEKVRQSWVGLVLRGHHSSEPFATFDIITHRLTNLAESGFVIHFPTALKTLTDKDPQAAWYYIANACNDVGWLPNCIIFPDNCVEPID